MSCCNHLQVSAHSRRWAGCLAWFALRCLCFPLGMLGFLLGMCLPAGTCRSGRSSCLTSWSSFPAFGNGFSYNLLLGAVALKNSIENALYMMLYFMFMFLQVLCSPCLERRQTSLSPRWSLLQSHRSKTLFCCSASSTK